jgi:hypothetical protein
MLDVDIIDIDSHLTGATSARAQLDAIEAALADMHDPLEQIIDDLQHQSDLQFSTLGGAAGTPWDPLDPTTVSNKMKMGYPLPGWPLVATGTLRGSAAGEGPYRYGDVGEQEATFGLDMSRNGYNIAALQQYGVPWREVTQHRHSSRGHEYTVHYQWHLPARPMIVSTEALADQGARHILAHISMPLL